MDLRVAKFFKYTCLGLGVVVNSGALADFNPAQSSYTNQPSLATIKAISAYNQGYSGKGVTMGIVDSGIDPKHIAFANAVVAGYDAPSNITIKANDDFNILKHDEFVLKNEKEGNELFLGNHGTMVASVAAGRIVNPNINDNIQGVAYNTKLIITADNNSSDQITASLNYMSDQSVTVINNSWLSDSTSHGIAPDIEYKQYAEEQSDQIDAISKILDNNTVMVFAAGNERNERKKFPGAGDNPNVPAITPSYNKEIANKGGWITVVATTIDGTQLTSYSNYCGVSKDYCIAAPGGEQPNENEVNKKLIGIGAAKYYKNEPKADYKNNQYEYIAGGTSSAAPVVSGAVALVAEKYPWMTNKNLATTILTTGTNAANPDTYWGRGLLDISKAINGPGIFEYDFEANVTEGVDSYFDNDISGNAGLVKLGTGSLTLTGDNTYTGKTSIREGKLSINGMLNSPVSVGVNGILRGIGKVFGVVNVAGTLAPGNSPGTLTVNGLVQQSSTGILQIDIDGTGTGSGTGSYSRLIVNNGTFTAGGTLNPILRGITGDASNDFTPAIGDGFRVVTAQNGVYGYFNNFIQSQQLTSDAQLDLFYYDGASYNNIDLAVMPKINPYTVFGFYGNDNAKSVGRVLAQIRDSGVPQATTAHKQLHYILAYSDPDSIIALTPSLSGEVQGAMAATAPEAMYWLQNSLSRQLSNIKSSNDSWVDTGVSWDRSSGSSAASGYSSRRYQAVIGKDLVYNQINRFGVGITYSQAKISPQNGSGTINETAPLIYGQYKVKAVILDSLFSYSFNTWRTQRQDPLYIAQNLNNKTNGNNLALGLGMRLPLTFKPLNLEPFARVLWQNSSRSDFSEGSDSPVALALPSYSLNGYRLLFGASLGSKINNPWETLYTYNTSIGLGADLGDLVHPAIEATLAGIAYNINSPRVGREFAQLDLNATYKITKNAYVGAGLNGKMQKSRSSCGINIGFNFN